MYGRNAESRFRKRGAPTRGIRTWPRGRDMRVNGRSEGWVSLFACLVFLKDMLCCPCKRCRLVVELRGGLAWGGPVRGHKRAVTC